LVKIEFKIGDLILCKKDYKIKNTDVAFFKNEYYEVIYSGFWDEEKKIIMYEIRFNFQIQTNFGWSFISTSEKHNLHLPNIEEYFYTKKEIRRMKINKIQE